MIWIDSITQAAKAAARTHSHCLSTWMENPISADKQCVYDCDCVCWQMITCEWYLDALNNRFQFHSTGVLGSD